jgi:anti-anti-sigma factor
MSDAAGADATPPVPTSAVADSFAAFDQATDEAGQIFLRVSGEVDLSSMDQFRQAMESLATHGSTPLVVDAEGLTFMDSAGLAVLLQAAGRNGGTLVMRNPQRIVRRLIESTGLSGVLVMEP